jgi:hypothetical protein
MVPAPLVCIELRLRDMHELRIADLNTMAPSHDLPRPSQHGWDRQLVDSTFRYDREPQPPGTSVDQRFGGGTRSLQNVGA